MDGSGYDQYNNQTDIWEYGYGSAPVTGLIRHTNRTFLTLGPDGVTRYDAYNSTAPNPSPTPSANIYLRNLLQNETVNDSSGNPHSKTTLSYDGGSLASWGGSNGHDSAYSTGYTTRGNVTTKTSYVSASASVAQGGQYDTAGNVVTETDGNGYQATISYISPDYSFPATFSKAVGGHTLTWAKSYDFSTGLVTDFKDPNQYTNTALGSTTYSYANDPLDRLTLVTRPDGGETQFQYNDTTLVITALSDQVTVGDGKVATQAVFDGIGRNKQNRTFEDSNTSGTNYISTERTYDALGRSYQVSHPHRQTGTTHNVTTTYDALSRVISVATDDGATTSTSYLGNATTTKDPPCNSTTLVSACTSRTATTDAAGRLISVAEAGSTTTGPGPVTTNYAYDVLDDLAAVCQGGSFGSNNSCPAQGRQFTYDWLKRLTSATNPETSQTGQPNGTIQYTQYDGNGNLLTKIDTRPVTTSMTYDSMNRVLTKFYNDGITPTVTYCYDGSVAAAGGGGCTSPQTAFPNALGRLTQVYSSASTTTYSAFDGSGRIILSSQQTPSSGGSLYQFGTNASNNPGYTYNLSSQLSAAVYPSGRRVTYDYDAAGRTAHVKNPVGSGVTYADVSIFNPQGGQYAYAPQGAIQTMTMGSGIVESTTFDPIHLEPITVQAGSQLTLQYSYCPAGGASCASNNGNLLQQQITTPNLAVTQSYSYLDGFSRLTYAQETNNSSGATNWSQTYQYDSYGNRAVTSGYVPYPILTPNAISQYVETINGASVNRNHWTGNTYDNAGNVASVIGSGRSFSYDAENRMTTATEPNTGAISYAYDGDGKRVQKTVGNAVTSYVYDANGDLVAEYGGATDTGTAYLNADALGSTRLLTNVSAGETKYYDYFPFGEDIQQGIGARGGNYPVGTYPGTPDSEPMKFTGKERDAETGLDYFGARYFSSPQGRFTSTDPISGTALHMINPQRWNMYAYAVNNPLAYTDPDGRDAIAVLYTQPAVHMGHAGVASVHHDGRGMYADFGPKNGPRPIGAGRFGFIEYKTQIQYGTDGAPTKESLTALANELADSEEQPRDSVTVYYFKTSDAETLALDAFIQDRIDRQSIGDVPPYITGLSDCVHFCLSGLSAAHVDSQALPFAIPRMMVIDFELNERLMGEATGTKRPKPKEKITSKFCYTDDKGKKVCQH